MIEQNTCHYDLFIFLPPKSIIQQICCPQSCFSPLLYKLSPFVIKEKIIKKDAEAEVNHVHPGCHPTTPTCLRFNIMQRLLTHYTSKRRPKQK